MSARDTRRGLYQKFRVTRVDRSHLPGGKHVGCRYFVLDLDHDPAALPALQAYADAVRATHPALARDLRDIAFYRFARPLKKLGGSARALAQVLARR